MLCLGCDNLSRPRARHSHRHSIAIGWQSMTTSMPDTSLVTSRVILIGAILPMAIARSIAIPHRLAMDGIDYAGPGIGS